MNNETKHTPEPWYADSDHEIHGADGNIIAWNYHEDFGATLEQITEANAHRIVACVNACAGIDTKVLEEKSRKAAFTDQAHQIFKLQEQRDELAAALREIDDDIRTPQDGVEFVMFRRDLLKKARALLAKVQS